MPERRMPRYPIYVPSKGRHDQCLTANFLIEDGVPFKLVIEEQEKELYAERYGEDRLLILPFSNRGSVIPARNWIKDHATEAGFKRHWQVDDNIRMVRRFWKGKRIRCRSGIAFAITEDFVDRYTNIALAGLEYTMFTTSNRIPPITVNTRVYSCTLALNEIPHRWRGRYNEDADLCLQVLSDGWCTVLIHGFIVDKITTMKMKGGNTDALYQGDGRAKMARSLEKVWPGVVETKRRFRRPQHVVHSSWRKFDTPLKRREDIDWDNLPEIDNFGLELTQAKPEIKSKELKKLLASEKRKKRKK